MAQSLSSMAMNRSARSARTYRCRKMRLSRLPSEAQARVSGATFGRAPPPICSSLSFRQGQVANRPNVMQKSMDMSTYTHSDFEQIATAIGIAAKQVANFETQFEAAALWFRLDKR